MGAGSDRQSRRSRCCGVVRVVGGEWGRDGPSLLVIRDVVLWRRGRRQIELCKRVGEERVLTVGRMGWRGGRGIHGYMWVGRRWMRRSEQCRGEGGMHYIVPCSLTAFLLRGCTQHFERRCMLCRIERHGSAWRSSPRTGRRPSMTGGPAMASTIQVSIGGAVHAGGEWLGWWRAGWDGGSTGGGQCTLLPR